MKSEELRFKSDVGGGMKFRYRSDDEMKDSGVEWLGKIPSHWTNGKFKNYAFYQEGPGLRTWQFTDEGIKVICVTNITESSIDFSKYIKYISEGEYNTTYKHFTVNKGDILLSSSGASWGKVATYNEDDDVILNTSTIRINENNKRNLLNKYIKYTLISNYAREQLNLLMTGACQPNFGPSHLEKIKITIPPRLEQEKIAKFLDEKTSEFDSIISKKEALIQNLEEAKKSLISEVVTGKVKVVKTDDGYQLVERKKEELKDSGVEWIGNVPKAWRVVKAKNISRIFVPQRNKPNLNTEKFGTPWVTTEDLNNNILKINEQNYYVSERESNNAGSKKLPKDSVITTCVGSFGMTGINTEEVIINQQLQAFTELKIDKYFFNYFLCVNGSYFESVATETTIKYVNREKFENTKIPYPSNEEQKLIGKYLNLTIIKTEKIVLKIINQINKIKEAKQSLISEAVTGKIEVLK